MAAWWVCSVLNPDGTRCFDRMATHADPRVVERDRDAHIRHQHAGAVIEPGLLVINHWHTTDDPARVKV